MRGEVLQPDGPGEVGTILGEDGQRYQYTQVQVKTGVQLVSGQSVDFVSMGDEARDIYPLAGGATNVPPPQQAAPQQAYGQQPGAPPQPSYVQPVAGYTPGMVPQNVPARKGDGLWTYFLRCFTKNYVQFNGRARRSEYWGFYLFAVLSFILAMVIDGVISVMLSVTFGEEMALPIFTVLFLLAVILPNLAVTARRLHDQDLSGWLILLGMIPYVGGLILLVFMFIDGKPMTNKHGPSPKYMMDDATTQAFL